MSEINRDRQARRTRAAGMEPCGICGLPAEPATWYCGGCWAQVHRDREVIERELGVPSSPTHQAGQ